MAAHAVRGSTYGTGCSTGSDGLCDDEAVSVDRRQNLRVLEGRFILEQTTNAGEFAAQAGLLALVLGPDGCTAVRRDDAAENAWAALWNGDEPHDLEATGMLSAIVAPLPLASCRSGSPRASMVTLCSSPRTG